MAYVVTHLWRAIEVAYVVAYLWRTDEVAYVVAQCVVNEGRHARLWLLQQAPVQQHLTVSTCARTRAFVDGRSRGGKTLLARKQCSWLGAWLGAPRSAHVPALRARVCVHTCRSVLPADTQCATG